MTAVLSKALPQFGTDPGGATTLIAGQGGFSGGRDALISHRTAGRETQVPARARPASGHVLGLARKIHFDTEEIGAGVVARSVQRQGLTGQPSGIEVGDEQGLFI